MSRNAKQQISDIPLKMRAEDDRFGFHRLDNDNVVDPRIKVTTNISVDQNRNSRDDILGNSA